VTIKGIADAPASSSDGLSLVASQTDVLLEAVRDLAARRSVDLAPDTGDALKDVEVLLAATYGLTRGSTGQALVGLLADAQSDERLAAQLQETLLVPRRRGLREILARGVASGQLAEAVQLDLAVDLVYARCGIACSAGTHLWMRDCRRNR